MRIPYIHDFEEWRTGFEFYYPVKVRFSETDLFGHLNNTVPFIYFEQARIEFLKQLGFMQNWLDPSNESIPVVANLQCDFLKQVFFDQELRVYVKAASVGNSSVDIHYMGVNADHQPVFCGRGTMVQMAKKTGKGLPWTEEQKELFGIPAAKIDG
ncbi:acyl-CoA thioesterase [Jeotgalibacillus haloalkalitolerans]|uniref:Thioesterase family protein n=1 Tax=Jeotgalibacillus haloalkalitolerans TaxID=3104292 RepID=A0ABU5KMM9_9BACL|nr:thioesterase family protein [Jeotgalibacillus sp. HH7-29]MDZ5712397.1 thioesterase family protein [Jeotgalibacillus sp. HH7-29]